MKTLDRLAKREAALKSVDAALFGDSEGQRAVLQGLFEKIQLGRKEIEAARTGSLDTVKGLQLKLLALQQERDSVERAVRVPARSLDPGVAQARADFRATCADFAQFVLDDRANFGEDYEEPRARIARLRNEVLISEKQLLVHRAASNAFDDKAMATGMRVTAGVISVAVLSLVGLFLALK